MTTWLRRVPRWTPIFQSDTTVVTGAEVYLLQLGNPSDSLATLIRPLRAPRPFPSTTFQSPLVDRLALRRAGVVRIVAVAPHDTKAPIQYPTDTLVLTIAPR